MCKCTLVSTKCFTRGSVSRRALCRGGVALISDVQREWKRKKENAKQDTTQPGSDVKWVMSKVIRGKSDPLLL